LRVRKALEGPADGSVAAPCTRKRPLTAMVNGRPFVLAGYLSSCLNFFSQWISPRLVAVTIYRNSGSSASLSPRGLSYGTTSPDLLKMTNQRRGIVGNGLSV